MQFVDVDPRNDRDRALVAEAFTEVLLPSFPAEELPRDTSWTALADGAELFCFTVAVDRTRVVGAAVSSVLDGGIGLLDYLAARPDMRSRGVGGGLVRHQRERWATWDRTVLAEVHDPFARPGVPHEDDVRRLRFYERCGARVLDAPWTAPRLTSASARTAGWLLLVLHPLSATGVSAAALVAWARAYYRAYEGPDADREPDVRAQLARMAATDPVGIRAITDHLARR